MKIFQGNASLSQPENFNSQEFFDKVVWTTKDVCSVLKCSERHIRELVSLDRIPYTKVGRLVRFYRDDVLGWLKQGGTR